jgi:hypothetical protein
MAGKGRPAQVTKYLVEIVHDTNPEYEFVTIIRRRAGASDEVACVLYGDDVKKFTNLIPKGGKK